MLPSLPPGLYEAYLNSSGVCTDTRKLTANSIFFALKGGNFNGNKFANQALANGCALGVIDEAEFHTGDQTVLVDNVLDTLQALAHHHRKQLQIPVIGITGSNGKTSTKELIAAVLGKRFNTFATQGNLNNHIGVPLSLLSIGQEVEMAVIEMGANHVGEIEALAAIADPDHGMITNIGLAHLEGFGGPEGVKRGKNELYVHLRNNGGTVFVNADDPVLMELSSDLPRITYGTAAATDCQGKAYEKAGFVEVEWLGKRFQSQMVGGYNFFNIMAAVCIGSHFGVQADAIVEAVTEYSPDNNRSQLVKTETNTIVLDAYNANPISMQMAVKNFAEMADPASSLPILGDMLELGEYAAAEHQKIVDLLASCGFAQAILVGPLFGQAKLPEGYLAMPTNEEAGNWLKKTSPRNSHFLIKGSRGIRLEVLVELL